MLSHTDSADIAAQPWSPHFTFTIYLLRFVVACPWGFETRQVNAIR